MDNRFPISVIVAFTLFAGCGFASLCMTIFAFNNGDYMWSGIFAVLTALSVIAGAGYDD